MEVHIGDTDAAVGHRSCSISSIHTVHIFYSIQVLVCNLLFKYLVSCVQLVNSFSFNTSLGEESVLSLDNQEITASWRLTEPVDDIYAEERIPVLSRYQV